MVYIYESLHLNQFKIVNFSLQAVGVTQFISLPSLEERQDDVLIKHTGNKVLQIWVQMLTLTTTSWVAL